MRWASADSRLLNPAAAAASATSALREELGDGRLDLVLAFVSGKPTIDDDVMRATLALLDFQQQVRVEYAPIIAVNQAASMEEKIRRALKKYGPLNLRKLRRHTNADRVGIQVFWQAMRQLDNFKEIQEVNGKWDLVP